MPTGTIERVFENNSKTGKRFLTVIISGKKGGVFNPKDMEFAEKNVGSVVSYDEKTTDRGFTNFENFSAPREDAQQTVTQTRPSNVGDQDRTVSMLASYAKDLVVAGKTKEEAVEIVKYLFDQFRSYKSSS